MLFIIINRQLIIQQFGAQKNFEGDWKENSRLTSEYSIACETEANEYLIKILTLVIK